MDHQPRLNRLTSAALYQAFIGQITSPICPHCGSGEETSERLLLFCPKWAAERQPQIGDYVDVTGGFRTVTIWWNSSSVRGICPPHIGTVWRARHDNNNNNRWDGSGQEATDQEFGEARVCDRFVSLSSHPHRCYQLLHDEVLFSLNPVNFVSCGWAEKSA